MYFLSPSGQSKYRASLTEYICPEGTEYSLEMILFQTKVNIFHSNVQKADAFVEFT